MTEVNRDRLLAQAKDGGARITPDNIILAVDLMKDRTCYCEAGQDGELYLMLKEKA